MSRLDHVAYGCGTALEYKLVFGIRDRGAPDAAFHSCVEGLREDVNDLLTMIRKVMLHGLKDVNFVAVLLLLGQVLVVGDRG